jgi:hypothetical protein
LHAIGGRGCCPLIVLLECCTIYSCYCCTVHSLSIKVWVVGDGSCQPGCDTLPGCCCSCCCRCRCACALAPQLHVTTLEVSCCYAALRMWCLSCSQALYCFAHALLPLCCFLHATAMRLCQALLPVHRSECRSYLHALTCVCVLCLALQHLAAAAAAAVCCWARPSRHHTGQHDLQCLARGACSAHPPAPGGPQAAAAPGHPHQPASNTRRAATAERGQLQQPAGK